MNPDEIRVGTVVVINRYNPWHPDDLGKVEKATKTFVVLTDGSKWCMGSGRPFGKKSSGRERISVATHDEIVAVPMAKKRHRALNLLTCLRADELKDVGTEALLSAVKALKEGGLK